MSDAIAPLESTGMTPALTYQHRLRVIGRRLDVDQYRAAAIIEIPGGILVRASPKDGVTPEVLEFPEADFPKLLDKSVDNRGKGERRSRNPLLPTGYEDFLRALGHWLDQEHAAWVTIQELTTMVTVHGWFGRESYRSTQLAPVEVLLKPDDIQAHLDQAFQRRSPKRRWWSS